MKTLSPRQELLQLHKRIYKRNKKNIENSVIHEDRTFGTYESHYLKAVKNYKKQATFEEMCEAVLDSNIVYVGDYHTLNQSQRSLLRILRHLVKKTHKLTLGFEVIRAKDQVTLDRYMKGLIGEEKFLQKIEFREHWFFDLWQNFKPLFDFSKYHQIPVYGLEASGEGGLNLIERDCFTAQKILEIYEKHPQNILIVFVGDLHIAPKHLPIEVLKLFRKKEYSIKTAKLYQNSQAIYWKLAEKGLEDRTSLVKISKNEFCRMHTPPIICQQSYLNWLEHEEGMLDYADAKDVFMGYLHQIASFLDVKLGSQKDEIEVFTSGDLSFLKKLKESKAFSHHEIQEIKRQILRSESYYIPKKKYVYLANVSVNHAAEEASHAIRNLCAGEEFPREMQDAFYANILHEALGFFGSKIINPKRKCLRPSDCRKLISYLVSSEGIRHRSLEYEIAKMYLEHERSVKKGRVFTDKRVGSLSVDLFLGLTHALGYYLGEKMFYGLMDEKLSKETVREIFFDSMEEEGDALRWYLSLMAQLKLLKLPKRI